MTDSTDETRPDLPSRARLDEQAAVHADLTEILLALGLGDHARPYSSHDVVQREVLPALRALSSPLPSIVDVAGDDLVCERHPGTPWPHGRCVGPGEPRRQAVPHPQGNTETLRPDARRYYAEVDETPPWLVSLLTEASAAAHGNLNADSLRAVIRGVPEMYLAHAGLLWALPPSFDDEAP